MWQKMLQVGSGGGTSQREYIVKDGVLQSGHTLTPCTYRLGGGGTAKAPTITYSSGYVNITDTSQGSVLVDDANTWRDYKYIGIKSNGSAVSSTTSNSPRLYGGFGVYLTTEKSDFPTFTQKFISKVNVDSTTTIGYAFDVLTPIGDSSEEYKYIFLFTQFLGKTEITDIWLE